MKIIAFYLPQFHEIPENNELWGKGFTEWVNVKKAKPLFENHKQPRAPLNNYYYDLTDINVMRWQVDIAKKYGVYGFCFYHYWFCGHLLLQKPIENYLSNKSLDLPFCLCWANHNWTDSWKSKSDKIKIKQEYGDEKDWKSHFDYFLPFFKDRRYIKNKNKPFLVIYQVYSVNCLNNMLDFWNELAIKSGFDGIDFAYQDVSAHLHSSVDVSKFNYNIEYQPQYARVLCEDKRDSKIVSCAKKMFSYLNLNLFNIDISKFKRDKLHLYDYDSLWQKIINMNPLSEKSIPGAFINVDTTPRRQERGIITNGMTPGKFEKYLTAQIKNARSKYNSDMIFLFAWNEWAEGAYIEPDEEWKYELLEAIHSSLTKTNELPGGE